MDDYIREILWTQEEHRENRAEEAIQKALEWEAAALGKNKESAEEAVAEGGGLEQFPSVAKDLFARENRAGEEAEKSETTKAALFQRMLRQMEAVEVTGKVVFDREERAKASYPVPGEAEVQWDSAEGMEQRGFGLGPQELSRFFQRDARRFS